MKPTTALFLASVLAQRGGSFEPSILARCVEITASFKSFDLLTLAFTAVVFLANDLQEEAWVVYGHVANHPLHKATIEMAFPPGVAWPNLPDTEQAKLWSSEGAALSRNQATAYVLAVLGSV